MLQQTQVATVLNYYSRFLRQFPSVKKLAAAKQSHVLRLWEGLGYYRRARNLHAAAQQIVSQYKGHMPRTREELEALPGIGRYTAAAILSFGLDEAHPILEANTRRLYRRLIGKRGNGGLDRQLWEFAERILPRRHVADWNDALIDIGATVCTPKLPECERCPLARWCEAFASGSAEELGRGTARPAVTALRELAVILEQNGRVAMRQRRADEWWSGLWDFVRVRLEEETARLQPRQVSQYVHRETSVVVGSIESLPTIRHAVTRYRIRLECFRAEPATGGEAIELSNGYRWIDKQQLEELPMTATARRLSELVSGPKGTRCC